MFQLFLTEDRFLPILCVLCSQFFLGCAYIMISLQWHHTKTGGAYFGNQCKEEFHSYTLVVSNRKCIENSKEKPSKENPWRGCNNIRFEGRVAKKEYFRTTRIKIITFRTWIIFWTHLSNIKDYSPIFEACWTTWMFDYKLCLCY